MKNGKRLPNTDNSIHNYKLTIKFISICRVIKKLIVKNVTKYKEKHKKKLVQIKSGKSIKMSFSQRLSSRLFLNNSIVVNLSSIFSQLHEYIIIIQRWGKKFILKNFRQLLKITGE